MIDKTYSGNFYDGVLSKIKSELTMSLPPGKTWNSGGNGLDLIGNPTGIYNAHQYPYSFPAYIEITFSNKYIYPTHYFLEGRRLDNSALLKSWNFEGRTLSGEWKILHSQVDKQFSQNESRLFSMRIRDVFTGFRINMTDVSSDSGWVLCLGQMEVFGNIFNSVPVLFDVYIGNTQNNFSCHNITILIFALLSFCLY